MIEPGTICPTCERRLNHPRKASSPKSRVKSLRIPEDEADGFAVNLARAALVVGITSEQKYPVFKFLDFVIDEILSNEEKWANAYTRAYSGVGT